MDGDRVVDIGQHNQQTALNHLGEKTGIELIRSEALNYERVAEIIVEHERRRCGAIEVL